MWFDLAITVILTTIKDAAKNPATKEKIKRAMLKIAKAILNLYQNDEEFIEEITDAVNK